MFGNVPDGRSAVDMLRRAEVDIVQTGISRSMMALDAGDPDAPLHIAEINRGDGFFLIGRTPAENWQWRDLEGATLIPIGFTPVPLTTLSASLRKRGVDIRKIRMLSGLSADEALAAFRRGDADYIHMPNPQAQALIADGVGCIAAELGREHGYLCYSSFAAAPRFIETMPHIAERFTRGFYKAQQWLVSTAAPEIASRIAPFFPECPPDVLERSVSQYKALGTWSAAPAIGIEGYDAMRDILIAGGLVKERHPYERLIRPEFARRAISAPE